MKYNRTKLTILASLVLVIIALFAGYFLIYRQDEPETIVPPVNNPKTSEVQQSQQTAFDKTQYSVDTPTSLWVIVNKKRPLGDSFAPSNLATIDGSSLQTEAADALKRLIQGAGIDQVSLRVISGYRSYASQQTVYSNYVKTDGQVKADTYSARPGYSEHQSGLAADIGNDDGKCDLEICFESTPGGKWLVQHAHEYGFIIRYEQNKAALTGYQYEPWHIRYVGQDLALELKNTGQTMEEFFGLPAASDY